MIRAVEERANERRGKRLNMQQHRDPLQLAVRDHPWRWGVWLAPTRNRRLDRASLVVESNSWCRRGEGSVVRKVKTILGRAKAAAEKNKLKVWLMEGRQLCSD